jgi:hypothetical protein
MAKTDNLKDFLTDVADAIREKTGTTDALNPQEFSDAIKGISTGGEVASKPIKDVSFCDYDGTIVHSYSKEDFLALEALPSLPQHDGLVAQTWNWSLEDAKAAIAERTGLLIGANFITDDGSTRLYISINLDELKDVTICFKQSKVSGLLIDWGDGYTARSGGSANMSTTRTHTYAATGEYCITILPDEDCNLTLGEDSTYTILGQTNYRKSRLNALRKVEVGRNVTSLGKSAFDYCMSLKSISIPQEVQQVEDYAFNFCLSLNAIVIPHGVTDTSQYTFKACRTLKRISLPNGITDILSSSFYFCNSLEYVFLPDSCDYIASYGFYETLSFHKIAIPPAVARIETYTFYNDECLQIIDFSRHTSVAVLAASNALTKVPSSCKIVVPDALYDKWIAATNWSSKSSQIIKKSDWDAQNS